MTVSVRKVRASRCPLRDEPANWPRWKRADALFMVCPACGSFSSHVSDYEYKHGKAVGEIR